MKPGFAELFQAAQQTVEMCEVDSVEKVIVYADSRQNPTLVEAFHTACVAVGCDVSLIRSLHRFPETDPPEVAIEAMKAADIVFDLATESWFYAPSTPSILDAGTRMLLMLVEEDLIVARPPSKEAAERAQKGAQIMAGAQEFRITTPEGTDFVARRGDRKPIAQKGYVTEPGEQDTYAIHAVNFAPLETEAEGTVYLNGGQILYPQHTYRVKKPVRLEIENGRIEYIDDSHEDGRIFKKWIEQFNDPNVYVIAHMGFGTDPRARDLTRYDLSAWESYYGGVLIAFGANDTPLLGGSNRASGHSDSILVNASFYADGEPILLDGEFTKESGLRYEEEAE